MPQIDRQTDIGDKFVSHKKSSQHQNGMAWAEVPMHAKRGMGTLPKPLNCFEYFCSRAFCRLQIPLYKTQSQHKIITLIKFKPTPITRIIHRSGSRPFTRAPVLLFGRDRGNARSHRDVYLLSDLTDHSDQLDAVKFVITLRNDPPSDASVMMADLRCVRRQMCHSIQMQLQIT